MLLVTDVLILLSAFTSDSKFVYSTESLLYSRKGQLVGT